MILVVYRSRHCSCLKKGKDILAVTEGIRNRHEGARKGNEQVAVQRDWFSLDEKPGFQWGETGYFFFETRPAFFLSGQKNGG